MMTLWLQWPDGIASETRRLRVPVGAGFGRLVLLILVLGLGLFAHSMTAAESRPNVLFIVTDQQHAGMMSCTGNPYLKTPALDALAAEGVRFERAYATNPVCVPSRFSLQTGRYPSAIGMGSNQSRLPVPDNMLAQSLGPLMRQAGYDCVYGGKVHLPGDLTKYMFRHGYRQLTNDRRQALAEACAEFLKGEHEKPFFLFASFINPHDICYMAINDLARHQGQPIKENEDSRICEQVLERARRSPDLTDFIRKHCPPVPDNLEPPEGEPECIRLHYLGARSFRSYARDNWSDDMWRLHRWAYARLTERVDRQIGVVLQALKDAGLEEETLVIFTSDHGDLDGAHRLEHKSILYEEAARIPFIVRWKGRIQGGRVDEDHFISNGLDLLPTLCDYAGIDAPSGLTGRSIRPLLEGISDSWRSFVVVESSHGRMIRSDQYKYCVYDCGENREFLVDLERDPGEMQNLAAKESMAEVLNQHRRWLYQWVHDQRDRMAQDYVIAPEN